VETVEELFSRRRKQLEGYVKATKKLILQFHAAEDRESLENAQKFLDKIEREIGLLAVGNYREYSQYIGSLTYLD
jgi:hypothetical protein